MRTLAMRLVGTTYVAMVAVFVVYLTQPFAADFMVVMVAFIALFAAVGLASWLWAGARTRPWFWLVATAPAILVLLFTGFYAPYAIAHPADALTFITTLVVLVAAITAIVAGLAAWREVRRGQPSWQARGRSGLVVAGVVGVVIGACLTSVLAAQSTGATTALSQPPATTAPLTVEGTKFLQTLDAKSGEVLGVFVTNKDGFAHSFDVDALGIHVPLAATSTTFVALQPKAAGSLQFYCAVPGHRDAGMVGTISVR